ncbi:DUF1697 domain-containing protein [Naasia sp. SYSU D00948]|uniref:DUF1697 domain-containing protein n=1 Tax=Naasia sp. SYSU D00948 TaxID=2817379 RepID=UPI001B3107C3|nr:DUF1697 domain-containing protein [Naasia sp. SYSU D00948]
MRQVALLRGINVGGRNKVPMAELRAVVEKAGMTNVRTVLASGNVVFDAETDPAESAGVLERAVGEAFGYDAAIHVVPLETVRAAVEGYPFPRSPERHAYAVFVTDPATLRTLAAAAPEDSDLERVRPADGLLYWEVEKGSTLSSPFGTLTGRKHAGIVTTRNLQTLEKVLAAG